jgi:hypothetical protein
MSVPEGAAASEQTSDGTRDSASLIESFDGLGAGFEGPQGSATLRNPSDNSIAAGPNHIVVAVNSRMAIFTKKGRTFDVTGRGPVWAGEYQQCVQGFWRAVRGVEQRRCRRSIR